MINNDIDDNRHKYNTIFAGNIKDTNPVSFNPDYNYHVLLAIVRDAGGNTSTIYLPTGSIGTSYFIFYSGSSSVYEQFCISESGNNFTIKFVKLSNYAMQYGMRISIVGLI